MNNILQALLLTFSIVFIIDFSGIVDSFKRFIWKLFNKIPYQYYRLKPIDCSLCMTFWLIGIQQYIHNVEILQVIFIASLFSYSRAFASNSRADLSAATANPAPKEAASITRATRTQRHTR